MVPQEVNILDLSKVKILYEIKEGWSHDSKFCVTDDERKYLLRIYHHCDFAIKKKEFELLQQLYSQGISMSEPIEISEYENGAISLWGWIEGDSLERVINDFSVVEQYQYGIEAGKILNGIHQIKAPSDILDWETRYQKKIQSKIDSYKACHLKYEDDSVFLRYVEENRNLIQNQPQVFHHGDYHINNLMIDENKQLVVIDFNRNDFGDPWEEFNRIVWSAQASEAFASGMIDGYFHHHVPEKFWKLLCLYISGNILSSLPWAIPYGEDEIQTMRNLANDVLSWYDHMNQDIPQWYLDYQSFLKEYQNLTRQN